MADTLLSISDIQLYGTEVADLTYTHTPTAGTDATTTVSTSGTKPSANSKIARILGFGFEGGYYDLDAPVLFMVNGAGIDIENKGLPKDVLDAFPSNLKVWTCDKCDETIRMDTMTGSLEDILLDVELGGGDGGRVSGGRVSGGRVSGGRVSGGRVSGGRVSGGRVSGGRVSGGKAD